MVTAIACDQSADAPRSLVSAAGSGGTGGAHPTQCPGIAPVDGTACDSTLVCQFDGAPNPCGQPQVITYAACASGTWVVDDVFQAICNPPMPFPRLLQCPPTVPAPSASCESVPGGYYAGPCVYASASCAEISAICVAGMWTRLDDCAAGAGAEGGGNAGAGGASEAGGAAGAGGVP